MAPDANNVISPQARVCELELLLANERARVQELTAVVDGLRSRTATLLKTFEETQEGLTNRLIREISRLKQLQLEMCDAVEAQEARLVQVLEDRLKTLRSEKVQMENALECEQERIVNHLQRQLEELKATSIVPLTAATFTPLSTLPSTSSSATLALSPQLTEQINVAVAAHIEREAELQRQVARLQEENQQLVVENLRLTNKLCRQSIEGSPIMEPLLSPSIGGRRSRGSISELHLAPRPQG